MTLNSRVMLSSLMLAVAATITPAARAQTSSAFAVGPTLPERVPSVIRPAPGSHLEAYYSHYLLDTPGDRTGMNGIGARLMWNPVRADYGTTALPSRFAVGLFGEYAPDQQQRGFSVGHVGVQGDLNVLSKPLFGRVLPVASLGAGMLWIDRNGPGVDSREFSLVNRSASMFSLAPSLGTHVGLWRQLGLRADVRDLITFRNQTLHHVQVAAGLSLPL